MSITLPYGTWPSPLAAADIAGASPRIDGARLVGDGVWWSESLPREKGRTAVLRSPLDAEGDAPVEAVLPAPWSARSRVHEYGGGAWTATDDGALVFVEHSDQRIYLLLPGGEPQPLTPEDDGTRFGDLVAAGGRVLAVREVHAPGRDPRRSIVSVPLDGAAVSSPEAITVVAGGDDFLASPALSPDGRRLAWIGWNRPDMPWDATRLHVGRLGEDGAVTEVRTLAGGEGVSVLQPEWTGPEELLFSADPSGRWNLFRADLRGDAPPAPFAVADADTGGPLWNLGARWYLPLEDGRVLAVRTNGEDTLVLIDPRDDTVRELDVPVSAFTLLRDARGARVLLTGSGRRVPAGLWLLDLDAGDAVRPLRGGASAVDPAWLPPVRPLTASGPDGEVHAFAYPPTNPGVVAPDGELPPYLVLVHGGPTTHVAGEASPAIAYLTSRGIGVLDVNYGGSTGYGRAYRERLDGQWGVVDVRDVAAAAQELVARGEADPDRIAIKGGSAGGWTVLCAVADTEVFAAGISRYGVADLRALAEDTHDFEARYLDRLVGPLPEAEELYAARSPLSRPSALTRPLLILQGTEDPVVPPSQAEAVRDALRANGVAHAAVFYEGEAHGFRRMETIVHAMESELAFLGTVFGFATPGVADIALD